DTAPTDTYTLSLHDALPIFLVDRVRSRIARKKVRSSVWLEVKRIAHRLGMRTSATMMYGVGETAYERALHLVKLRDLQDETGGLDRKSTRLNSSHVKISYAV